MIDAIRMDSEEKSVLLDSFQRAEGVLAREQYAQKIQNDAFDRFNQARENLESTAGLIRLFSFSDDEARVHASTGALMGKLLQLENHRAGFEHTSAAYLGIQRFENDTAQAALEEDLKRLEGMLQGCKGKNERSSAAIFNRCIDGYKFALAVCRGEESNPVPCNINANHRFATDYTVPYRSRADQAAAVEAAALDYYKAMHDYENGNAVHEVYTPAQRPAEPDYSVFVSSWKGGNDE